MSDGTTAADLVDRMVEAGNWPEPDLLEEIAARGPEAVEPLRALLRCEPQTEAEESAIAYAADLLAQLGDPAAIPEMVELLRRFDADWTDELEVTLARFGPSAVEPLLEIVRDPQLKTYPRSMAINALKTISIANPEFRPVVTGAVRDAMARYLDQVPGDGEADDDLIEQISFLVSDIVDLLDDEGRPLIARAFERDVVDRWIVDAESVEEGFRTRTPWRAGRNDSRKDPGAWIDDYRRRYRNWKQHGDPWAREPESEEALEDADLEALGLDGLVDEPDEEPEITAPIRRTGPALGRNDPCWCGSGKKYKKCHMERDRGA